MNKSRAVLVAALGTMTPAFLLEQQAKAHATHQFATTEIQRSAVSIGPVHAAMKSALLALSPGDKLRIAGDQIRLAKAKRAAKGSRKKGKWIGHTEKSRCDWCDVIRKK